MELFVVTQYGCNSSPSHLYPPQVKVFMNKEDAYQWFHRCAPSLTDENNRAEQGVMRDGAEYIQQIYGYHYGDMTCAKRPYGVKIERIVVSLGV